MFKYKEILKLKLAFWKLTFNYSAIINSLKNKDFDDAYVMTSYNNSKEVGTYEFNEVVVFSIKTRNKELENKLDEYINQKYGFSYQDYIKSIFFNDRSYVFAKLNLTVYEYLKKTFPYEISKKENIEHVLGKFFTHGKPKDFEFILNQNTHLNLDLKAILENSRFFLYESNRKKDIRLKALVNAGLVDAKKTEHIDYFLKLYHKSSDYLKAVFNLPESFNLDFFNQHPLLVKYPQFQNEFVHLDLSQMTVEKLNLLYDNLPELEDKVWKKLVKNNKEFFLNKENVKYFLNYLTENDLSASNFYKKEDKLSIIFELYKNTHFTDELLFELKNKETPLNKSQEALTYKLLEHTTETFWYNKFKRNFTQTEKVLHSVMDSIYYYSDTKYQNMKEKLLNIALDNQVNIFKPLKQYESTLLEQYTYFIDNNDIYGYDATNSKTHTIPEKIYNKIENALTQDILLSKYDNTTIVAQTLLSEKINILSILEKREVNPLFNYDIGLDAVIMAPNFEKIPNDVLMYYVNHTSVEQLLSIHGLFSKTLNITYYLAHQPRLFEIYFNDDKIFNFLKFEDKKEILEQFFKNPNEKSATHLLNSKLNWPWEKINVSSYSSNPYLDEKIKEQIEQKIEYIKVVQEKENLENIFKNDTMINETQDTIVSENLIAPIVSESKPKKRNKI